MLKIIYTGWFVAERHLLPFPKRLPAWFERLELDPAIIRLERRAYWESAALDATTTAVAAFGHAVRTPARLGPPGLGCPGQMITRTVACGDESGWIGADDIHRAERDYFHNMPPDFTFD